jgi:hypothetical protein
MKWCPPSRDEMVSPFKGRNGVPGGGDEMVSHPLIKDINKNL